MLLPRTSGSETLKNMNMRNCLAVAVEIWLLEPAVSYVIIKDVPMDNLATAMSHLMVHFPVSEGLIFKEFYNLYAILYAS